MNMIRGLIEQFGVDQSFFVMGAIFIGTYLVVSRLAFRRLSSTLVEREHRIEGREEEALRLRQEFDGIEKGLESEMRHARAAANAVFVQMKTQAATEQKSILGAARERAAQEIGETRKRVAENTKHEVTKLEEEVPRLARLIVEQIVGGGNSAPSAGQPKGGASFRSTEAG